MLQTVLGAGGAIGVELAKALRDYDTKIRLVSRNPVKVNPSDELFKADLLDEKQTLDAVKGSDVVYLTVGLPYKTSVWSEAWPKLVKNVIKACETHQAKLVFFDNVYMYDPTDLSDMTEDHKVGPTSRKGKVRQMVSDMITQASKEGRIKALIARSADFYGPSIKQTSMLNETTVKPLSEGKTANWMGPLDKKHSFTYTPDAGKATAILGNDDTA